MIEKMLNEKERRVREMPKPISNEKMILTKNGYADMIVFYFYIAEISFLILCLHPLIESLGETSHKYYYKRRTPDRNHKKKDCQSLAISFNIMAV